MGGRLDRQATVISRIALGQFGLVTSQQLRELGVSRQALYRRIRSGSLVRRGARVYAVAGSPGSWEQSALAACLDRGPTTVLSHHSAATAWRFDLEPPASTHVTVPYGRSAHRCDDGVVVHRTRSLDARDRAKVRRLPVTSLVRTVADLAGCLGTSELTAVVDDVLSRRLTTPERLVAFAHHPATGHLRGAPALRSALGPWVRDERLESVAEARFLRLLRDEGFPPPATQHVVVDNGRAVARIDFAWPARMIAVEVDGFRWHANPRSHAKDSQRANRLAELGWNVLRVTPTEVERSPAALVAALRRHLLQ